MEKKTVLITGIGGNVGQGIIRNINSLNLPIRIIGTNITEFSAGNHFVDSFYKVPYGYESEFISVLEEIIEKEKVDLIIPSTDYETYNLAINSHRFSCKIAVSGVESSEKYLDKYLTWKYHQKNNIPFAECVLPSAYNGKFDLAIAKPRKGRGSKGIIKNINNPKEILALNDDEYLIQKMFEGREITTAVYIRYCDRKLHGLISFERSLENGATTYCKVVKDFDTQFISIAEKMLLSTDLVGSFNIQSIVTNIGEIFPFEINCRISGTNSIRSKFGFKDVQYTILELLYNIYPEEVYISNGFAYRFLSDVIYTDVESELKGNNTDKYLIF